MTDHYIDRWRLPLWAHPSTSRDGDSKGAVDEVSKRASRAAVFLSIGNACGGVMGAVWLVIASHQLDLRTFGRLTLLVSLGSVVSLLTDLGVPLAITAVARDAGALDRRAFYVAVGRRLAAAAFAVGLLVLAWTSAQGGSRWATGVLYGGSIAAGCVTGSWLAALRGRAVPGVEAAWQAASKVLLIAAGSLAAIHTASLAVVVSCYVVIDLVGAAVISAVARRHVPFEQNPDLAQRHQLAWRVTLPFAAAPIIGVAYERVDTWLVGAVRGAAAVAIYAAAYKVFDIAMLPARSVAATAIAAVGTVPDRDRLRRLVTRSVMFAAPLALTAAIAGPIILRHGFGRAFAAGRTSLWLLAASAIPGAVLAALTPVALLLHRRAIVTIAALGLAVNGGLNLVLISSFGPSGAAATFAITETVMAIAVWRVLQQPVTAAETADTRTLALRPTK